MELISGLADEWYQPKEDDTAKFLLSPMDQLTWISVDALTGKGDLAGAMRAAFSAGIKDWENVHFEGAPVQFDKKSMMDHLGKIPRDILYDIYSRLNEISSLNEDDEKNL